jgi:hypothetical protein
MLEAPVVDVSTKLEATDRYISWKEAKEISGLTEAEIEKLKQATLLVNNLITKEASKAGLVNEDGKIEFGMDENKNLVVVDIVAICLIFALIMGCIAADFTGDCRRNTRTRLNNTSKRLQQNLSRTVAVTSGGSSLPIVVYYSCSTGDLAFTLQKGIHAKNYAHLNFLVSLSPPALCL